MNKKAALQAIQEPVQNAGVQFDDDAAEKLVDDLRRVQLQQPGGNLQPVLGPYVEPVQLQVVCYRLWEKPRVNPARISTQDLADIGEVDQSLVDQSLADYYTQTIKAAALETGITERSIREWFNSSLITEGGRRSTVLMGINSSGGLDNQTIRLLVDTHLVRGEKRGGATWFELSHDRVNRSTAQQQYCLVRSQLEFTTAPGRLVATSQPSRELIAEGSGAFRCSNLG